MSKKPTVLMILDGYGLNENKEANAVAEAKTPVMDKLMKEYPFVKGNASGMAVGLPAREFGKIGNEYAIKQFKENYGISAAGYYYRVRKVKEAYLDQVSEEKLQENLAIVPKELFHENQGVQKNPSKLQTTDSFLDIFQDDLRIRIYENTDEQLLFRVLRNLKNAE